MCLISVGKDRQLLCVKVDGRNVRCVNISCLEMQNDAYVYMYCVGDEVCKAPMQMAFADRGDERPHDYAGGSTLMNDQISSVSQMLQGEIIACVAAAHELLHLRLCSKAFLEILGQDSVLRGSVALIFRGALFEKLVFGKVIFKAGSWKFELLEIQAWKLENEASQKRFSKFQEALLESLILKCLSTCHLSFGVQLLPCLANAFRSCKSLVKGPLISKPVLKVFLKRLAFLLADTFPLV